MISLSASMGLPNGSRESRSLTFSTRPIPIYMRIKEAERSSAKFIPYRLNERASRSLTVFQSRLSRVEFELNVVSGFLDFWIWIEA